MMTDQALATVEPQKAKLPDIKVGGNVHAIVPQDFAEVYRFATVICTAEMAPRGLDSPEKAMVAIMHGLEVGLTPMNALQSIAVINSRATLWGDGALGLVQASGKMESHKEWFEGEGNTRKALCIVKRRGDPEAKLGEFSVENAKKASLWGKTGPWTQYPDRMLKMRARAFALRDGFSDVLRGLGIAEEVQDIPVAKKAPATAPTPPSPPSPPSPDAQPEQTASEPDTSDQPFDPETYLAKLEDDLSVADSEETVAEVWDDHDVESTLTGDEDFLQRAFDLKNAKLNALELVGNLAAG